MKGLGRKADARWPAGVSRGGERGALNARGRAGLRAGEERGKGWGNRAEGQDISVTRACGPGLYSRNLRPNFEVLEQNVSADWFYQ